MVHLLTIFSRIALFTYLLLTASTLRGQISFGQSQNFAFQVKQVDEFIERFNGQKNTVLLEYMRKYYPEDKMERYELLTTLFNHQDSTWDLNLVKAFLREVNDPEQPVYLDYYDQDWYAQVDCEVTYKGKKQAMSLFLAVESSPDLASEWVIKGVKADFLCLPELENSKNMLNPVSHATDFMNLHKLFEQPEFARGYMHKNFQGNLLTLFYHELSEERLKLREIRKISYHFLQIRNWIFTVSQFRRPGRNSGWLIHSLSPMTEAEKSRYRLQELFLD